MHPDSGNLVPLVLTTTRGVANSHCSAWATETIFCIAIIMTKATPIFPRISLLLLPTSHSWMIAISRLKEAESIRPTISNKSWLNNTSSLGRAWNKLQNSLEVDLGGNWPRCAFLILLIAKLGFEGCSSSSTSWQRTRWSWDLKCQEMFWNKKSRQSSENADEIMEKGRAAFLPLLVPRVVGDKKD